MTVSSETSRISYAGNGATTEFSVNFYFLDDTDLVVVLVDTDGNDSTLVLNTDYTVTGAGDPNGGTVTLTTAPASGEKLVIYRQPPLTQGFDLTEGGPLPAETAERAWDKLTMAAQWLKEQVERTVRLPLFDTSGASTVLPTPEASKYLGWNSDASAIVNRELGSVGTEPIGREADELPRNRDIRNLRGFTHYGSATYVSASSFKVSGDPQDDFGNDLFEPGLRVAIYLQTTGAWRFGTVDAVSYDAGADETTVTVTLDDGSSLVNEALTVYVATNSVRNPAIPWPWVDARAFGVVGDGVTDDRAALAAADASGSFRLPQGTYRIGSDLTLSSRVFMDEGAVLKPDAGVTLTIAGLFHPPEHGRGFDNSQGTVTLAPVNLYVPGDYPTIQAAVDAVPKRLAQYVGIIIASGTYAEDVVIDGIQAVQVEPDSVSTRETARLTINGANGVRRDPNVRVKSILATGCSGGTGHPTITLLTIYDQNPYTNEQAALEFYGCHGASVGGVSFVGNGAGKCIVAYASTINNVDSNDYGDGVNQYALVVKHGGRMFVRNRASSDIDASTGTLLSAPYWILSGTISVDDIDVLKGPFGSSAYGLIRWDDISVGSVVERLRHRVMLTGDADEMRSSRFETYFESLSGWTDASTGTGSFTLTSTHAKLATGATAGDTARFVFNRYVRKWSTSGKFSRFVVHVDKLDEVGNGELYLVVGSLNSRYVGFKVASDGALYGVANDGTTEYTVLMENPAVSYAAELICVNYGSHIDFYREDGYDGVIELATPLDSLTGSRMLDFQLKTNEAVAKSVNLYNLRLDVFA